MTNGEYYNDHREEIDFLKINIGDPLSDDDDFFKTNKLDLYSMAGLLKKYKADSISNMSGREKMEDEGDEHSI